MAPNTYIVTGIKAKRYDYVDRKTGNHICSEGVDYYLSRPVDDNDASRGNETVKSYVNADRLTQMSQTPMVGDRVIAILNRWNKYYIVGLAPKE